MKTRFLHLLFVALLSSASTCFAGNETGQELGDAIYNNLVLAGFSTLESHSGIYTGPDTSGNLRTIEVTGDGDSGQDNVQVQEFNSFRNASSYYGAYTVQNSNLSFNDRRAIVYLAGQIDAVAPVYPNAALTCFDPQNTRRIVLGSGIPQNLVVVPTGTLEPQLECLHTVIG